MTASPKQPKISTLTRGTAEGAVILELDRGFDAADAEAARRALHRFRGIWGVAADQAEDWPEPEPSRLLDWLPEDTALVVRATLGEPVTWPSRPIHCIASATDLCRAADGIVDLAQRLAGLWIPEVTDLVLELEHDEIPPSLETLSLLEETARPEAAYTYIPPDYAYRALLVQRLASASPLWGIRWRL